MKQGFTLLELIVVIIIIGVLATLGFTQYTKVIEKGRNAEARAIIGLLRKNVYSYYLANGTIAGMSQADAGIASGQAPPFGSCDTTHYYEYYLYVCPGSTTSFTLSARRCLSAGKSPQGSSDFSIGIADDVIGASPACGGALGKWQESDTWASRTW